VAITVYTVITGGYDSLHPTYWPGVCLTDRKLKPAKGWTQRLIHLKSEVDLRRASRVPKMMPHRFFKAEYSLYMDGNIRLLTDPQILVDRYLKHTDMALFPHPERKCIYHEAKKVIAYKKADAEQVKSQIAFYRSEGYPTNFGLTACWVILRRNTPKVQKFGELWWEVYQKFAARDQLSFDYIRWRTGVKYFPLPGNLFRKTSKHFRRSKHQKKGRDA